MKKVLGYGAIFLSGVLVETLISTVQRHGNIKGYGLVGMLLAVMLGGVLYYTGYKKIKAK